MDALGAYGSDTSSGSDAPKPNKTLTSLLGAASDASSSEDEVQNQTKPRGTKRARIDPKAPVSLPAAPTTAENGASIIHWDIDYLAHPRPIPDQDKEIGDEIKQKRSSQITPQQLENKLQQLKSNLTSSSSSLSWAEHLQSQHEFHNPHFFASVVEHFGIEDNLGSQIDTVQQLSFRKGLQPYEQKLFPKLAQNVAPT